MRNASGYAVLSSPTGHKHEADTFTCAHCNKIVMVQPKCDPADLGGFCKQCTKLVCPECYGIGSCTPWEKQMEEMEARFAFRQALGR